MTSARVSILLKVLDLKNAFLYSLILTLHCNLEKNTVINLWYRLVLLQNDSHYVQDVIPYSGYRVHLHLILSKCLPCLHFWYHRSDH